MSSILNAHHEFVNLPIYCHFISEWFASAFVVCLIFCLIFVCALIKETAHNWYLHFGMTHIHNSDFVANAYNWRNRTTRSKHKNVQQPILLKKEGNTKSGTNTKKSKHFDCRTTPRITLFRLSAALKHTKTAKPNKWEKIRKVNYPMSNETVTFVGFCCYYYCFLLWLAIDIFTKTTSSKNWHDKANIIKWSNFGQNSSWVAGFIF